MTSENEMSTLDGLENEEQPPKQETQNQFVKHKVVTECEFRKIFDAKCEDFGLDSNDKLFERFQNNQFKKPFQKHFDLESCSLGPKAIATCAYVLRYHPCLKLVSLSGNSMGNKGAIAIANLLRETQTIIYVDIASNSIQDAGAAEIISALQTNKSVISIKMGSNSGVSRNTIGQNAAKQMALLLKNNKVLTDIDLTMAEITSDSMRTIATGLKANHTLQNLSIGNNNIGSRGCRKLLHSCMQSQIVTLNLANNHIKDDVGPDFAKYLTNNRCLRSLNLSGNDLTKGFIKAISVPFSNSAMLTDLNLSHNPIMGAGVNELGPALALNRIIKSLNLSMCQIEITGFESFCTKLENNRSLLSISLSHNPIGDAGAEKLATVLKRHSTLRELDLELCEITDEGGNVLIPAMAKAPALERVSLKNNLIRNSNLIIKTLTENTHLIAMNVEYNDIDFKFFNEIQKVVKANLKRWQDGKKARIADAVNKTADVEFSLHATRGRIKDERRDIAEMQEVMAKARKEADTAIESHHKNVKDLTSKLDAISKESNEILNVVREEYNEKRMETEKRDYEVASLQGKHDEEVENFKRLTGTNANIDIRISEARQKIHSETLEIEDRLAEARLRYKDARNLFESARSSAINIKKLRAKEEAIREAEAKAAAAKKFAEEKKKKKKDEPEMTESGA